MRRLSLFIIVSLMGVVTMCAQAKSDAQKYLDRYLVMVEKIEAINTDSVYHDQLESVKAEYKGLTKELSKYKKNMTDVELEQYYKYKARYQKKMTIIKAKRSGKAIKGWVKGWM